MASKYVQVYTDLKKKIENRELEIGQALPAEAELMSQYQVSRDTIRKSLGILENQGYIQKARGRVATVAGRGNYTFPFERIASFKELNAHLEPKSRIWRLSWIRTGSWSCLRMTRRRRFMSCSVFEALREKG